MSSTKKPAGAGSQPQRIRKLATGQTKAPAPQDTTAPAAPPEKTPPAPRIQLTPAGVSEVLDAPHVIVAKRGEIAPRVQDAGGKTIFRTLPLTGPATDGRTHFTDGAALLLECQWSELPTVDHWVRVLLLHGFEALFDAAKELAAHRSTEELDSNTLSAMGNLVSRAVRRRVLREVLVRNEWNLARSSEELRAGGAGSLVRLIRDLGLSEEYRAARRAGAGKPGPKTRLR